MHIVTAAQSSVILGYCLFALVMGALAFLAVLADPETLARRRRNRIARHARVGCPVCTELLNRTPNTAEGSR